MGWLREGVELAEAALRIEEEGDGEMEARACLFVGIGYQMKAQSSHDRIEKEAANEACRRYLVRSARLDGRDHLALYHLALQQLREGALNEAMDACRACLAARPECAGPCPSLPLFAPRSSNGPLPRRPAGRASPLRHVAEAGSAGLPPTVRTGQSPVSRRTLKEANEWLIPVPNM
ncbi:uncharacterized protein LOC113229653 [Hyposmocoma kahamanoa]|uniref:uncharacterized protein LOC113229653 n=1 Tax=Hyposmocoma kahamanoa TaxID=1477025 RepID=UPI000E6D9705|nr:uncharacterized protein LOC113229653 [Hyposmocoma kahamanoa]